MWEGRIRAENGCLIGKKCGGKMCGCSVDKRG